LGELLARLAVLLQVQVAVRDFGQNLQIERLAGREQLQRRAKMHEGFRVAFLAHQEQSRADVRVGVARVAFREVLKVRQRSV
jgi:hypothetical protein